MIRLWGDVGEDSWRSSRRQRLLACVFNQHLYDRSLSTGFDCCTWGGSAVSVKVGRTRWASDVCILYLSEGDGGEGAGSWVVIILYRKPGMVVGCMWVSQKLSCASWTVWVRDRGGMPMSAQRAVGSPSMWRVRARDELSCTWRDRIWWGRTQDFHSWSTWQGSECGSGRLRVECVSYLRV